MAEQGRNKGISVHQEPEERNYMNRVKEILEQVKAGVLSVERAQELLDMGR